MQFSTHPAFRSRRNRENEHEIFLAFKVTLALDRILYLAPKSEAVFFLARVDGRPDGSQCGLSTRIGDHDSGWLWAWGCGNSGVDARPPEGAAGSEEKGIALSPASGILLVAGCVVVDE